MIYFHPGDRVRLRLKHQDALYRGELPNGTEGTMVGLREATAPYFDTGNTTMAIVNFDGIGQRLVGLAALEFVRAPEPGGQEKANEIVLDSSKHNIHDLIRYLEGDHHMSVYDQQQVANELRRQMREAGT